MKICPSCEKEHPNTKNFCRNCGTALVPNRSPSPEVTSKRYLFETEISKEPQNASAIIQYADYLETQGLDQEAVIQYLKALELDTINELVRRKVIKIYRNRKDWDAMAVQLLILLESSPNDLSLNQDLVTAYLARGRQAEAATALKKMSEIDPRNVNLLIRRRDIVKQIGTKDQLLEIYRQIVVLQPRNLSAWLAFADLLLQNKYEVEALSAFKKILQLDNSNPRANLYFGISQYNMLLYSDPRELSKILKTLEIPMQKTESLSPRESSLARLYFCSACLRSGISGMDVEKSLNEIKPELLDQEELENLSSCFLLLGQSQGKSGDLSDAIASFRSSFQTLDNTEARSRLSAAYLKRGESLEKKRKYKLAIKEYDHGLHWEPDNPKLKTKRHVAVNKRKKRNIIITAILFLTVAINGGVGAIFYFCQGAFHIQVHPDAKICLLNGNTTVAELEGSSLRTGLLRYGSYELHVEKKGFESVRKTLKVGFGRNTEKEFISLVPLPTFNVKTKLEKEKSLDKQLQPGSQLNTVKPSLKLRKYVNTLGMEFVYIPPGTFMMGSPVKEAQRGDDETQHWVNLTKGFYMQTTEVTQKQWYRVIGNRPWSEDNNVIKNDNFPAVFISWSDCQEFVRKINLEENVNKYRLPTEAEWEYAARAGSDQRFFFGENAGLLRHYAWYGDNAFEKGEKYAHRVATKKPNAWGLYDMYGNVWEFCQDWYEAYPSDHVIDPKGPTIGGLRVVRGGGWRSLTRACRSALRYKADEDTRLPRLGFRLVKDL